MSRPTSIEKKEVEPVEPVLKGIFQSNTYRKDLSCPHFDVEPRVQEKITFNNLNTFSDQITTYQNFTSFSCCNEINKKSSRENKKIRSSHLKPATSLKKSLCHRCFPVDFGKFLRTPFLTAHFQWLLLKDGKL